MVRDRNYHVHRAYCTVQVVNIVPVRRRRAVGRFFEFGFSLLVSLKTESWLSLQFQISFTCLHRFADPSFGRIWILNKAQHLSAATMDALQQDYHELRVSRTN